MADATFFTLSAAQGPLISQLLEQQSASTLQAKIGYNLQAHHGSAFQLSCQQSSSIALCFCGCLHVAAPGPYQQQMARQCAYA